jgi:hypothetical protein
VILLVGGIFIGVLTILSHLGWFGIVPGLWAILLIAADIRDLSRGRPPGQL